MHVAYVVQLKADVMIWAQLFVGVPKENSTTCIMQIA